MSTVEELSNIPGDWILRVVELADGDRIAGITFRCPCGCGMPDYVPIATGAKQENHWQWDGDRERPTLSPSLLRRPCGWHGFLELGRWNWCGSTPIAADCLHRGFQR